MSAKTEPKLLLLMTELPERAAMLERLQASGFATEVARNEEEVLLQIESERGEILLCDEQALPEQTLFGFLQKLKARGPRALLPVLLFTERFTVDGMQLLFGAGVDEFLRKPVDIEELILRVKALARKVQDERWLVERAQTLAEKIAERDDELDDLRRFAQDIVSTLPSALLVIDKDQHILFINQPFLQTVQIDRREVLGRKLSHFLNPELLGPNGLVEQTCNKALHQSEPLHLRRIRSLFKNSDHSIADLTITSIEYAGVRQVLLVIEDVTEQARIEAAVARERAKLEDIVNAMKAALCLIDRSQQILWKNRTFNLWFGNEFGEPGLSAFMTELKKGSSWDRQVFHDGQVIQRNWSIFTYQGAKRFFANIIAPIVGEPGEPIGQALVLTQDVTEQETRVEQLSLLRDLSQYLQHTLNIERLHRVILMCVTAGHALGFNRAFLFKRNRSRNTIDAAMAVGPSSREEAFQIWAELSAREHSLRDMIARLDKPLTQESANLFLQIEGLSFNMEDPGEVIVRTALEKRAQVITDATCDERVTPGFFKIFGSREFVSVPLIAKGTVVGVLMADNLYSGRKLTDDHVKQLTLFASQAALAIENAETYAELQESLKELQNAQDQIVHSEQLAAVGKMAAHVAHEIRNPLATIGGFARAIVKRPDSQERVIRNANVIMEEATRLENMLKGVMDFSRPAAPVLQVKDLNAIADRAFHTHEELLQKRKIACMLDLDPSLPEVMIDENQMLQVIQNLIRNAGDSMIEKGGKLTIRTKRLGDYAALEIADTGSGIPKEIQDRLFSPFFTTKPDGTGLGLAVTKKIVDDHGGRIEFESVPQQGTTFRIQIPIHRPSLLPRIQALHR